MGFSPSFFVGLGRDKIFFVGMGWDRFGNPLPCHPLLCTPDFCHHGNTRAVSQCMGNKVTAVLNMIIN